MLWMLLPAVHCLLKMLWCCWGLGRLFMCSSCGEDPFCGCNVQAGGGFASTIRGTGTGGKPSTVGKLPFSCLWCCGSGRADVLYSSYDYSGVEQYCGHAAVSGVL